MNGRTFLGIVTVLLGLLVAAVPYVFFPVCPAGLTPMRCFWTARAECVLGMLTAVSGVLSIVAARRKNG